jgi:cysteinyl-tRNA synthetase
MNNMNNMKKLSLYDSLAQKKSEFVPLQPGRVTVYVCGVTVYDFCHLGHARTYVAFDIIQRYLRHIGYAVHYVRNVTDIDDKILARAQEAGVAPELYALEYQAYMDEDFERLGLQKPDQEPRATQKIPQMIALIQQLIAQGNAYSSAQGDVFFRVRSFASYGALSHQSLEGLSVGARVEKQADKESGLDFVLWKAAKAGEPFWDSPWGPGRPGWHIECSAMVSDAVGDTVDIHGGGFDLRFPHHENERAQTQSYTGVTFARYWMHTGFLNIDDQKMSKSLNNFLTIRSALERYPAEVVRYFLACSHYRSEMSYSEDSLQQAYYALDRLYTAIRGLTGLPPDCGMADSYWERFYAAMNDDFNTPVAFSVLFEIAGEINRAKRGAQPDSGLLAQKLITVLKNMGEIFGILQMDPEVYFQSGQGEQVVQGLIGERQAARAAKDWRRADQIRDQLLEQGIALEDAAGETSWRRIRDV